MKITINIALEGCDGMVAIPEGYESLAEFLEQHTMVAVDELLETNISVVASVMVEVQAGNDGAPK